MAHTCGIEYFELAHFYTQWGARHAPKIIAEVNGEIKQIFGWKTRANSSSYKNFLTALSEELKRYLEEKNLRSKVFIHVSDEPNASMLRSYKKASEHRFLTKIGAFFMEFGLYHGKTQSKFWFFDLLTLILQPHYKNRYNGQFW